MVEKKSVVSKPDSTWGMKENERMKVLWEFVSKLLLFTLLIFTSICNFNKQENWKRPQTHPAKCQLALL